MCCGGESYWTCSEATVAVEQKRSVQVVIISICGSKEFNRVQTFTSLTTDSAAVDTEAKVYRCVLEAITTGLVQRQRPLGQWGRVSIVFNSVCGGGEVNQTRTLTSTTKDDAAVDTVTKV